jgi:hypothetical protein
MLARRSGDAVEHADARFADAPRQWNWLGALHATVIPRAVSGGEAVLVQQAAETVNPLDSVPPFELPQDHRGDGRSEVNAAVRALVVVMGHELVQHAV